MATTNEALQALKQLLEGRPELREATQVKYEGTAITLPPGMNEDEAIQVLQRRKKENEEVIAINEIIPGYPVDALLGLQRAMKQRYGWTGLVPTPGFFGPQPPAMIGICIDDKGTTVQVPWGRMTIPGIDGWISPSVTTEVPKEPKFRLVGQVRRKSSGEVNKLANLAREEVRTASIYKGKAIRIAFPTFDDDNPFNPQIHSPAFLRLDGVKQSDLIFKEEVDWAVQTSIFTPIQKIERLREMGTPFRSGVLVAGDYGVGKTLLANVTALVCEKHHVTFIYLANTGDISMARRFAAQYAPAVIFAEDVDAILGGEERDQSVNEILNTIDGVEGKHDEVMVIFSTNHADRINRALLRPGRMDAVITIDPPDAKAAERLIRLYAKETLDAKADLKEAGELLAGNIPAAIREVVERAKKAALAMTPKGTKVHIGTTDLTFAAKSMQGHLAMLKAKPAASKVIPMNELGVVHSNGTAGTFVPDDGTVQ